MKTDVIVLGNGLSGSAFKSVPNCEVLSHQQCDITKKEQVKDVLNYFRPKTVINCAGIVPKANASIEQTFKVNSFAPRYIADLCYHKHKFIHISTDCVYKGDRGQYTEKDKPDAVDIYGMSKILGETSSGLVIRTSFVGLPDPTGRGLLAWAQNQPELVGFDKVFWNGITTKELVHKVLEYIHEDVVGTRHVYSYTLSKYELLMLANNIFDWNKVIYKESEETDKPHSWDKTLSSVYSTGFITKPIEQQLRELI